MDYKERLAQFEDILSSKDLINDPIIDLYKFRHLCFRGIPDKPGIRQKSWKILLGYLPTDKRKWQKTLSENRSTYYSFVRDLLAEPSEEELLEGQNSDHPLNPAPNSKWAEYFADNIILEQIDKDVCRTLPDFAFFQQPVPQSPLSPLSPRLSHLELIKRSDGAFSSLFEKLENGWNDDDNDLSTQDIDNFLMTISSDVDGVEGENNNDDGFASLEASIESLSTLSPISPVTNTLTTAPTSRRTSTSSVKPAPIDLDAASYANPIAPIRSRRSIFRRVQHLNKDFFRRENRPASPALSQKSNPENGAAQDDEENQIDLHWEAIERILFIYAKLNPGIGYVQGMNEILGPIYYTMANDGDEEGKAHAEADSFFVFTLLMADIRDHFVRSLDHDDTTGIGATMTKMNRRLRAFAFDLWEDLEEKSLHPPYYSFRWLTVMCAQEFALPDVIRVWDSVFADHDADIGTSSNRFEFLIDFCCAMIICVKDELLKGVFEDNIKLLQHYPIQDPGIVLQKAYQLRESRLLAKLNGNEIDYSYSSDDVEYGPDGVLEEDEPRRGSSGRMWLQSNGLVFSNGYTKKRSDSLSSDQTSASGRSRNNNHSNYYENTGTAHHTTSNHRQPQPQRNNLITNTIINSTSIFRRPLPFKSAQQQPTSFSSVSSTNSSPSFWHASPSPNSSTTSSSFNGFNKFNKSFYRDGTRDSSPLIPASAQTRMIQVAGQTKAQGLALFNKMKDVVANRSATATSSHLKKATTMSALSANNNNNNTATITTLSSKSQFRGHDHDNDNSNSNSINGGNNFPKTNNLNRIKQNNKKEYFAVMENN
ncbi:3228_t:CDS:2 [Ambispora gerdemannii]|uniref:3228_t:CDS:1 n=1 Tax=Ambispora gerdemannii TaxID=144530 RepID=A0A9N9A4W8_9GLOM|nr:3228_t:CDS:2 [Ambispora gerdemannii]